MKIAIYSRKSKFTGKGESIENQIIKCKQFIQFKFDIDIDKTDIDIFIDEGFSGKNENRPRYQDMIKKVKNKEIDSIIIYQLNRLGRNARDIHNTMQMCEDLGCVIYSATEGFDSSTSFGRAIIGILASLAQLEREQLAERVKDNMYTLAKMGRWLGGQSPLGFDGTREYYIDDSGKQRSITRLKPNKEELQIVKLIYEKYLDEKSLSQVGKWSLMNNFKGKNGGNIDKSAIDVILKNPVYVKSDKAVFEYLQSNGYEVYGEPNGNGLLRYGQNNGKEDSVSITAIAKHKGIIDSADWITVQEILKENTEKAPSIGKSKTALLTGILKCKCGSNMQVRYGKPRKDGTREHYYTCTMKVNSGGTRCNSKNLNGTLFEKKLIKHLKTYSKEMLLEELQNTLNKSKELKKNLNIASIDADIETANKSMRSIIENLKKTTEDSIVKVLFEEMKQVQETLKDLQERKDKLLEDESKIVLSQSEIISIVDNLDDFLESYDALPFERKQKKLNILLSKIIYDEVNIHVEFNLKKKLDSIFNVLSGLFLKHERCQTSPPCFTMLDKFDILLGDLLYSDMPIDTFANRITKAKLYAGISQEELSHLSGLSRSTINELEAGYRDEISKDTLLKLLTVLDSKILCDDYCNFILNQQNNMKILINKYTIKELSLKLNVNKSTIERWRDGKYQIKREIYNKLQLL